MKIGFIIKTELHYHTPGDWWTADISLQAVRNGKQYGGAAHWEVKSKPGEVHYDKFIRLVRKEIISKVIPLADS